VRNCFIILYMCGLAATAVWAAGGVVSVVRPDPRTGRLVRSVVNSAPKPAATTPEIARTVDRVAQQTELPAALLDSVIQVESNYDSQAVSPKGALGLMQLIPSTAKRFGVADVFDPADNIQGGARYLKYLLGLYGGDQSLALAAYNAGEGAVAHYGGLPPYSETVNYVARVQRRLESAGTQETRKRNSTVQPSEAKPADATPAYNRIREVMDADGKLYYISR